MRYFVSGGAGFIGSHLANYLLSASAENYVTVYDNFSSGKLTHLNSLLENKNLKIIKGELKDLKMLIDAMDGHDVVFHLASNPDIAKAIKDPTIDFWEGTYLAQNVLEAMRLTGTKKIIYSSGSGIYGDCKETLVEENHGPLLPISTYGASKLACEALMSSYCHMFEFETRIYRFANVVGPKQTHGVAFDFIRKLKSNPNRLEILGDGTQSKSYIHVNDVIDAIIWTDIHCKDKYQFYNVATGDYITVKEIADLVVQLMGLERNDVNYNYTGGARGWKGDVPVVRFDLNKILATEWRPKYLSREALTESINSMINEV